MATSKPKEGLKEKLKTLFQSKHDSDGGGENSGQQNRIGGFHRSISSYGGHGSGGGGFISDSILRSIDPGTDVTTRLKSLGDLKELVSTKLLEDGAVERLWICIQDLVNSNETAQRRVGLEFMIALCRGQSSRMGLCRLMFFEYLKTVSNLVSSAEELGVGVGGCNPRLAQYTELLRALSRDGQDVSDFEEEIGPLCSTFLYEYLSRGADATELLKLLQNLIKFHSAYFDEDVMRDSVKYVCILACRIKNESSTSTISPNQEIIACLNVLDAILCYGCWPGGILLVVSTALCKLVNVKSLCGHCWMFMRNLLGSHFGHGAVYTMCSLMQAAETYPDEGVLRGAVFFVGASLWGAQQVDGLRHTPGSVLSSMLRSLASNSGIVAYEVALSVQRLVGKYGKDLQLLTWDLVLQTLARIFEVADANRLSPASNVIKVCHDTLTSIEQLHEAHRFNGSLEQLFNLIEYVAKHRPEGSILRLMAYRTQSLSPARGNWLSQLHALLDTYYNRDARSNVRIEAVHILRNLYVEHRHLHSDELVEVVVLPVFADVDNEKDFEVQARVINLLVDMAKSTTQNCFLEVMVVLERTMNHRLGLIDFKTTNAEELRQYFVNIECALGGLIEIVKVKWNATPATEALHVLDILTAHVQLLYARDICDELGSSARSCGLKFLLSLGAEIGTQRLVYKEPNTGQLVASAYIVCADPDQSPSPPLSPISSGYAGGGASGRVVDFVAKEVIQTFASCIDKERQWSVLRIVLAEIPTFLLSRRLALSYPEGMASICASAIRLCTDSKTSSFHIYQGAEKLVIDDVKENVFALLTALIPYRSYFDERLQQQLASTIQGGVTNKAGYAVISTVSCLLEMPDIMAPTVRELVRRLGDLPPTPIVAIPILELLSTLMRMSNLYKTFPPDDYENVLMALTNYVNPYMFTDYIVAMAYQVLFRWFLRVPLLMRPRLAQYILRRIAAVARRYSISSGETPKEDALSKAYDDAREVCITFLAYYTFTDEPPTYERSPIAQQLFNRNRTRHWTIGDRIFSITSSGNPDGCPNCKRKDSECSNQGGGIGGEKNQKEDTAKKQTFLDKRRRHASAIQGRVTGEPEPQQPHRSTRDDTFISSSASVPSAMGTGQDGWPPNINDVTPLCFCWCEDWIELTVRHAIGRQAWVVRISDGKTSKAADDIDTLAFMASGGADEEVYDEETDDDEDGASKGDAMDKSVESALRFDDDEAAATTTTEADPDGGGTSNHNPHEKRPGLTISIGASGAKQQPDRKVSLPEVFKNVVRRRRVQRSSGMAAVNEYTPPDVRSILLQLFSANIGKTIHSEDVNIMALVQNEAVERAMKNLDRVSAYEAHKVGVIYIGLRQTKEAEILGNQYGSTRYDTFLSGLGRLINLRETDPSKTYLGGLDTNGRDGEFTYHWSDQSSQVIFHVATRMPNRENDPSFTQKKLHIGNDFVAIVFNESGYDYKLSTISGQFARVAVVVQPLDEKILHIKLVAKNEISSWLTMKEVIMSDDLAPLLCRQMSIRADASARIWEQQKNNEPFLSRTAERLRHIKSIKDRFGGKPLTVESMFD